MAQYYAVYDIKNWFVWDFGKVGFIPSLKGIHIVNRYTIGVYLLELGQVLKWPVLDRLVVY